jgi:hypothetical protein
VTTLSSTIGLQRAEKTENDAPDFIEAAASKQTGID